MICCKHRKVQPISDLCPSICRSCQLWSGTSRREGRDFGASWSRSSTQWPWRAEDRLHLAFLFTALHMSLPCSYNPDHTQNSSPQQHNGHNCNGPRQYTAKRGGSAELGGACVCLHVYVCVCLKPSSWGRDWDTQTWRLSWMLVFVVCLIFWFPEFCRDEVMVRQKTSRILWTTDQSVKSPWRGSCVS